MYGIFTYIYHTNQPMYVNKPYMDPLGIAEGDALLVRI